MRIDQLWLSDFRCFESAHLELAPAGITVILGGNGQGKTSLLEAVAYLARLESFRGAAREPLVRSGAASAVVRARGDNSGRSILLEAEIPLSGRDRLQVNRQPLRRAGEILGFIRVTVFSPDDLDLVKGGPTGRRRYLDEVLSSLSPHNRALRTELERVLRQRGMLLRQCGGHLTGDASRTLDVWDLKLAEVGTAVTMKREELLVDLSPSVEAAYRTFAPAADALRIRYRRSWEGQLSEALRAAREQDLRRGATTVGPHRDELEMELSGMPARSHASQGEQRCVALALRLGSHAVVGRSTGSPPVLLLDDVFSELDHTRRQSLMNHLVTGQTILSSTGPIPGDAPVERRYRVCNGTLGEIR